MAKRGRACLSLPLVLSIFWKKRPVFLTMLSVCEWLAGALSVAYLCAIVVHRQHAEHVQRVSALDEFAHGIGHGALASIHCGRSLVTRWAGQLVHADDAVLLEWAGHRGEI